MKRGMQLHSRKRSLFGSCSTNQPAPERWFV